MVSGETGPNFALSRRKSVSRFASTGALRTHPIGISELLFQRGSILLSRDQRLVSLPLVVRELEVGRDDIEKQEFRHLIEPARCHPPLSIGPEHDRVPGLSPVHQRREPRPKRSYLNILLGLEMRQPHAGI